MTDLSVIILTGNEALHIQRCLERLAPLSPRQIFIVESQKGDNTHSLAISTAESLGWQTHDLKDGAIPQFITHHSSLITVFHDWPGLQSTQFNWSLDNLPIEGQWILRLDADEYLTDDGIAWLKANLEGVPADCNALEFTLERKFCGGIIRHGTNGIKMIRMFRRGTARYAEGLMDERLIIANSTVHLHLTSTPLPLPTPVVFYDESLMPMSEWREKHRNYAKREAQQALSSLRTGTWTDPRKARYYRLPPYLRAFTYFAIRYFAKLGFLDGYAGLMWNFWQGLWYRLQVDREISKLKSQ